MTNFKGKIKQEEHVALGLLCVFVLGATVSFCRMFEVYYFSLESVNKTISPENRGTATRTKEQPNHRRVPRKTRRRDITRTCRYAFWKMGKKQSQLALRRPGNSSHVPSATPARNVPVSYAASQDKSGPWRTEHVWFHPSEVVSHSLCSLQVKWFRKTLH